jgi:hypothetical protein
MRVHPGSTPHTEGLARLTKPVYLTDVYPLDTRRLNTLRLYVTWASDKRRVWVRLW